MSSRTNLEICKSTRKIAAQSLAKVLKDLLQKNQPISEVDLRDKWLEELRKYKTIFPDGWYSPPPHGIIVLFGTDVNVERVRPKSMRPKEYWPRKDIFLNLINGVALVYASPVDKKTGIIGDFGLTLYFGKNKKLQNHLKNCLRITHQVFYHVKIGMRFSDLNNLIQKLLKSKGLVNNISSSSDIVGTNIGHTIPTSYKDWDKDELMILNKNDWSKITNIISKKRVFINAKQKSKIKKGMSFTIEPRPYMINDQKIPIVMFHTIVLIKHNNKKELLTNFDEIFRLIKMDYMF